MRAGCRDKQVPPLLAEKVTEFNEFVLEREVQSEEVGAGAAGTLCNAGVCFTGCRQPLVYCAPA
jgi:hypothetical protein